MYGFRLCRANRSWLRLPLVVSLLVILSASSPATARSNLPQIHVLAGQKAEIRNGDLIFRKATGLGSQYILSIDTKSNYSHSGIIRKEGDQITVIQSAPEQTLLAGGVREDSLESFLEDIPLAAIYRLRQDPNGLPDQAVQIAKTFMGRPFDARLDMTDGRALYCTELVWLSYKQAGIDLLDGHFDDLNLPLVGQGYYILPSSLVNSHWLYQVMILKAENSSGG